MPLSEHEQKLLDEMERNLYSSEADEVSTPSASSMRPDYRHIILGSLLVLVGIAALLAGVVVKQPVIGVLGFIVMVGGVLLALRPSRRSPVRASAATTPSRAGASEGRDTGFVATMQRRWEKRSRGE